MHKVDKIQPDIVRALQSVGATVVDLSAVGNGCPDIAVGIFGRNYFMEIKDPETGRMTGDQIVWHDRWKGQKCVVKSVDEALRIVGVNV